MGYRRRHDKIMKSRPIVLLIEGNESEEMLERLAIKNSEIDCVVRVARDGLEACQILFERGEPPPTFILLDTDLPKLSGFEVLSRIRGGCATKRLPVIIFASPSEQAEIDMCFDLGANSYVHKDKDRDCFETRLKLLLYYWIAVNQNGNA